MHSAIYEFVKQQRDKGRIQGKVLEVGSLNFNGGVRDLMSEFDYIGTDMQASDEGSVDVICKAEDLLTLFDKEVFDSVIYLDSWEHTEKWREALYAQWEVLKTGGWFVVSIAGIDKGFHGYPSDYWRMTPNHISAIWGADAEDITNLNGISMGWAVQKIEALPDLSKIELISIHDEEAIRQAKSEFPAFLR